MTALLKPTRSAPTLTTVAPVAPPLGLTLLITARQTLLILIILGVVAVGLGYGWTLHSQQQWAEEYQQLQNLTQSSQKLAWATAQLEGQLSPEQSGPLVPPKPDQMLVMPPAPSRPQRTVPSRAPSLMPQSLAY